MRDIEKLTIDCYSCLTGSSWIDLIRLTKWIWHKIWKNEWRDHERKKSIAVGLCVLNLYWCKRRVHYQSMAHTINTQRNVFADLMLTNEYIHDTVFTENLQLTCSSFRGMNLIFCQNWIVPKWRFFIWALKSLSSWSNHDCGSTSNVLEIHFCFWHKLKLYKIDQTNIVDKRQTFYNSPFVFDTNLNFIRFPWFFIQYTRSRVHELQDARKMTCQLPINT